MFEGREFDGRDDCIGSSNGWVWLSELSLIDRQGLRSSRRIAREVRREQHELEKRLNRQGKCWEREPGLDLAYSQPKTASNPTRGIKTPQIKATDA